MCKCCGCMLEYQVYTSHSTLTQHPQLTTHQFCVLPGIRCSLEARICIILFPYLHHPCNVVVHMIDVDVGVGTE